MKKLIFISFICLFPLFLNAQVHKITLNDGTSFNAIIKIVDDSKMYFNHRVDEIKSDFIELILIKSIEGKIPRDRKKAISKINPSVVFQRDFSDDIFQDIQNYNPLSHKTSGDLIQTAGRRYLSGIGLALGGGIVVYLGADGNDDNLVGLGGAMFLAGAITSLTGHFKLIEAGKAMNREAVTLSAAESGIGLAINF